jgi:hypothetical protein
MKWPKVGKGKGSEDKAAEGQAPQAEEAMGTGAEKHSAPDEQAHSSNVHTGAAKADEATTGEVQAELRAFAPALSQEAVEPDTVPEEPEEDIFDTTMRYAEQDRQEAEAQANEAGDTPDSTSTAQGEGQGAVDSVDSKESGSEKEMDDELVEEIVHEINAKNAKMDSGRKAIGDLVYDLVFDGNMDLVLVRSPNRSATFEKIFNHPDSNVSAKMGSSYVRATAFSRYLVSLGKDLPNLTFSHYMELVSVEDADRRVQLAEEINRNPVSVQKTRKRVTEVNAEKAPDKSLRRIFRKMKDPLGLPGGEDFKQLVSDEKALEKDLSKPDREELLKHITKKKEHIADCVVLLDKLEEALEIIDA